MGIALEAEMECEITALRSANANLQRKLDEARGLLAEVAEYSLHGTDVAHADLIVRIRTVLLTPAGTDGEG